jgi:RHS repeat-associated protein
MLFGRHIVEINATNNTLVRSYAWGLDLSGTMDGAGGVGGLAWVTLHTASGSASGTHFVCYDGNGNIVALVNAATGEVTARYEYGPFGEPIRISGPAATLNPFRFSTKRTDNTTDFVLYEYRVYSLSTGRWPNRDRINETSFKVLESKRRGLFYNDDEKNLYGFVRNNPVSRIDFLGFYSAIVGKCEVVVLYGHGSSSRLHEFKFADCSAGHFVGCESKATNDKIPSENQIPGAPSTEEELYSGLGIVTTLITASIYSWIKPGRRPRIRRKPFAARKTAAAGPLRSEPSWLGQHGILTIGRTPERNQKPSSVILNRILLLQCV